MLLFIPVIPLRRYRVIGKGGFFDGSWTFLGKVPFTWFHKVHLAIVILITLIVLLEVMGISLFQ